MKTKICMTSGTPFPVTILARADGRDPGWPDLNAKGSLNALLSHDEGVSFPDKAGVALMRAVLDLGGTVALEFANLADALACQARLAREVA